MEELLCCLGKAAVCRTERELLILFHPALYPRQPLS
jgi:hypothetical protein